MHEEHDKLQDDSYGALESACRSSAKEVSEETADRAPKSGESLLKNWPLMSSIIVYCIFSLHDMAYSEVIISSLKYTTLKWKKWDDKE